MQEYEVCLIDLMSWRKTGRRLSPPCSSHLNPIAGRQERKEQTSRQFLRAEGTLFLAEAGRPSETSGRGSAPMRSSLSNLKLFTGWDSEQWQLGKERRAGSKTPSRTRESTMETPSSEKCTQEPIFAEFLIVYQTLF